MKTKLILLIFIVSVFSSCKIRERIVEVEKEVVKTEYKTNTVKDSVFVQDSVFVTQKGDTVYMYRYKYIYKDKLRIDTLVKTDTLRSTNTVIKEVNILTPVQTFKNKWFGWIVAGLIISLIWIFRKQLFRFL